MHHHLVDRVLLVPAGHLQDRRIVPFEQLDVGLSFDQQMTSKVPRKTYG